MELYLRRSQRKSFSGAKILFCLDGRVALSPEEQSHVSAYALGNQIIYNSESAKQHIDRGQAALEAGAKGIAKGFMHYALAKMSLNISINSLTGGQRIECKDLDELMGAEEAIKTACANIRSYLDIAATFDGREEVYEYNGVHGASAQPARINATPLAITYQPQPATAGFSGQSDPGSSSEKSNDLFFIVATIGALSVLALFVFLIFGQH